MFDDNDEIDDVFNRERLLVIVQHYDETDEIDENDENDERFKWLQIIFLKDDVSWTRDEFDDLDDNDEQTLAIETTIDKLEVNEKVEIVENFISLLLNDNDRNRRNRLIFIYQKLKDYVKFKKLNNDFIVKTFWD